MEKMLNWSHASAIWVQWNDLKFLCNFFLNYKKENERINYVEEEEGKKGYRRKRNLWKRMRGLMTSKLVNLNTKKIIWFDKKWQKMCYFVGKIKIVESSGMEATAN